MVGLRCWTHQKICMVTLTRKAAREMLERVTKVLSVPEGQELPVKMEHSTV